MTCCASRGIQVMGRVGIDGPVQIFKADDVAILRQAAPAAFPHWGISAQGAIWPPYCMDRWGPSDERL